VKKKDPKKQSAELAALNEQLMIDLEATKTELADVKQKLNTVLSQLVQSMDARWQKRHNALAADFDPIKLDSEALTELLDIFAVKQKDHEMSVEVRAGLLEKQVTDMSLDLRRAAQKCLAYELGLKDLLRCHDLNAIKDRVYQLQIIAGEAYYSTDASDMDRQPEVLFAIDGVTERMDCDALRELDNANRLNLVPPTHKYPGDTLLRDLHPGLKLYIVKELSIEKASGADWRMLAQRLALPQATIDEWIADRLTNAAGHVLDAWVKACPSATVRLLHRHLASPLMRCTILCKRLTDFYDVS
jgi:hypothetical protein